MGRFLVIALCPVELVDAGVPPLTELFQRADIWYKTSAQPILQVSNAHHHYAAVLTDDSVRKVLGDVGHLAKQEPFASVSQSHRLAMDSSTHALSA